MTPRLVLCGLLLFLTVRFARAEDTNSAALSNAVILIIRHAEKPDSGLELSPAGLARANAYAGYFKNLKLDDQPLKIDSIFATADSRGSHRPRLTVEPTAKALGLSVDSRFENKDVAGLAKELSSKPHGHVILIAWHHGRIPTLLQALGADPQAVVTGGKWPDDVFDWLIEVRYDAAGHFMDARRINENLMPGDSHPPAPKN